MRFSSKFIFKAALTFMALPLFYMYYKFYISIDVPDGKDIDKNLESVIIKNSSHRRVHKSESKGIELLKKIGNRIEDMYNFKAGVKRAMKDKMPYPKHEIEIWGKASIAEYLWTHILDGNSTTYANGLIKHGEINFRNLNFRFRSGPGIVQNTVPSRVKNLVLILNGKDEVKIKFSKTWLDYLVHFKSLKNVALMVLGDEKCDNDWILPYLKTRGGMVDFVFLIYDSKLIDDREFFQWPLGVATYRGFPNLKSNYISPEAPRQNLCSFLGTVYKNSSRQVLQNILLKLNRCYVAFRDTWVPTETQESMINYIKKLIDSDLSLNPVGQNTECYRIYEALSLGSIPVVENVVTPGNCDTENKSPLRLLKNYRAPIILVENWNELEKILDNESKLSHEKKVERRKKAINWYTGFKEKMKHRFLDLIHRNFFKERYRPL